MDKNRGFLWFERGTTCRQLPSYPCRESPSDGGGARISVYG